VIAKHVETTERERRLARPVIDALRAAGLFRLFTPRALGGLEIDPVNFARVVEQVSTTGSTRGAGSSVTSATRRRCDTTASFRTVGWKPSGRCTWVFPPESPFVAF
jgi:alkylation response protein AidB-like acyl-CoA dehydrogenase